MPSIPDEKVQEIRDRVDIVDVVGRYVELRRAGRNFKGLCPFHQERTPSFNVNPERKGYKCFGCGAGGDAIRFVMEIEGKSFPEALRKLAEIVGIALPEVGRASAARSGERDEAYAIMRVATELYETLLWNDPIGQAGRDYVAHRGLEEPTVRAFRLGYAPAPSEAGWDKLTRALDSAGCSLELALKLGLVGRSDRRANIYDKFRGRLMFPVIAPGGEVIAFSGRVVPPHDTANDGREPPKYVNSSESLLFTKGKALFGLATARPAIRTSKRAVLVEGNVDVLKLHQWGYGETVAPLGTALTPEQAQLLSRFAEQVVMCFDGDKAGKKAAWAALPLLLEADLDVRMVLLPQGEDPDSVGKQRFDALVELSKPALEEMMVRIAARAGDAAHARARGLDRVVPLIAHVRRDSARELYIDRAANLFDLPASRVQSAVHAAQQTSSSSRDQRQTGPRPTNPRDFPSISGQPVTHSAAVRPGPPLPAAQAQLTMLLVDAPHLAAVAERTGASQCIADPRLAPIAQAVLAGARSGKNPTMPELLDLVDPVEQRRVHAKVFAGGYRSDSLDADPQKVLLSLVHRCREEAIDHEIRSLEADMARAKDEGFRERATALVQRKIALRRQQAELRQQAQNPTITTIPPDAMSRAPHADDGAFVPADPFEPADDIDASPMSNPTAHRGVEN